MPPQPSPSTPTRSPMRRLAGSGVVLACVLALAGCATTSPQQADSSQPSRLVRDTYLSRTQSDPLGAYLSSKEFNNRYANEAYSSASVGGPNTLASAALDHLGVKYKFGGDEPDTGFDCSGLVAYAAEKSMGLKLPRRSRDIARLGTSINRTDLKKGDLVFFNTLGSRFSHVGIYLGNQKFVHAPRAGAVVRIENMNTRYWTKRYNGARRLDTQTASLN